MALSSSATRRIRLFYALWLSYCPYCLNAWTWNIMHYKRRPINIIKRQRNICHGANTHRTKANFLDLPRKDAAVSMAEPSPMDDNEYTQSNGEEDNGIQDESSIIQEQPPRISRTISVESPHQSPKQARIRSRDVNVSSDFSVTVWEWEKPAAVVETYWQVQQQGLALTKTHHGKAARANQNKTRSSNRQQQQQQQQMLDPFGLVTWPGSVVAVQELLLQQHELLSVRNRTVLVLGAGVGVEAQAAAMLGATKVIATDVHPTTLQLLEYGATQANLQSIISTQVLDLYNHKHHPLPECDVMIVADVLYNDQLAEQVIQRCVEARLLSKPPVVLVSDSQRFVHDFERQLNQRLKAALPQHARVAWMSRRLPKFTGSGVCIDADQTYDVKARVMWIGLLEQQQQQQLSNIQSSDAEQDGKDDDSNDDVDEER
ncbi:hypothetical protein MPSEU_000833500 [Mayamaea pseudoterrestris]|nr:hypothetical protein MPSEU_000833500 [Mayamaea pseudoterrestris]